MTLSKPLVTHAKRNRIAAGLTVALMVALVLVPSAPAELALAAGVVNGVGPGSYLSSSVGGCSSAFLFQQPGTHQYFLSTAGHCLGGKISTGGDQAPPGVVASSVNVCYIGCERWWVSTQLTLSANETYHPVAFNYGAADGPDFGLIRIPTQYNKYLRPNIPVWGGVDGHAVPEVQTLLVFYGYSIPAEPARVLITKSGSANGFSAYGPAEPGDSGSAVATAKIVDGRLVADKAVGVVSGMDSGAFIQDGLHVDISTKGPTFTRGLDAAEPVLGFRPRLVEADEVILLAPPA